LDFTRTGQVETKASAYWRQRVQAAAPVASRTSRNGRAWDRVGAEPGGDPVHGPALYVTLSPIAQAHLDDLRREQAAQRARR
jgi:hypothetical protein